MNRMHKISTSVASMAALSFIVSSVGMTGCSSMSKSILKLGVNMSAPYMTEAVKAGMAGVNTCYGQGQYGTPGMLVMLTMMAELAPENYTVNWTAAQASVAAAAFNEIPNPEYAEELAWQGYRLGMRSLKTHRKFRKAVDSGMPVEKAIELLPKKYIEGMTWTSMSLLLWMSLNLDDVMTMTYAPQVNNMLKRAVELDSKYCYALPLAIDAAFSAMASELMVGCGAARAETSYRLMTDASGGKMLIGDVYYARFYAVMMRDHDLYQKLLNKAIDAPDDILEYDGYFLTTLAKGQAKWLLANEKKVFANMGLIK